jgi:hypothetical protein
MSYQNNPGRPESGIAISVGFGTICALLLALIIWQPNVAIWIAQSAEAEFSTGRDTGTPSQLAQTKRKPIEPGAWSQSAAPEDVSQTTPAGTVGRSQERLRHAEESR